MRGFNSLDSVHLVGNTKVKLQMCRGGEPTELMSHIIGHSSVPLALEARRAHGAQSMASSFFRPNLVPCPLIYRPWCSSRLRVETIDYFLRYRDVIIERRARRTGN